MSLSGGLCIGGLCPGGFCPGGLCPGGVSVRETRPHSVKSDRYASYWNAFMLKVLIVYGKKILKSNTNFFL